MNGTLFFGAAGLALSIGGNAIAADTTEAWRVFIADHQQPKVSVIDAATGETLDMFAITGPASLIRSESGRSVFAVQGDAGVVNAISSGISFEDHGDHGDIDVEAPKLLGVEIAGQKPSHFVEHDGQFAAFFDGEGVARVFRESDVLAGKLTIREVKAAAPHHGVVIPFRESDIVSEPNPDDSSKPPIGTKIVDGKGEPVGETVTCAGLHGEAVSGNLIVLGGCADGILVVKEKGGAPVIEPLPFTPGMKEGRVSTLVGGKGLQYFLGNFGPQTVSLIDPTADRDAFRLVELPTRRVHFAVDPIRPKFAYVFTEDGQLHQLDVVTGKLANSLKLTDPYSMDGHWNDPRPRIAVADDKIVVTDPLPGKLHLVDAASFAKAGEIAVEGKPYNIVAVGGSGESHDGEGKEAHSHDHGDDRIYKGYFEDNQIKERALSDWAGDWQSVYTYLQDGTLDPVMTHKAKSGEQTADEHKAYYEVGYKTDVERITIAGDAVIFFKNGQPLKARYASDGHEILTYEKGNRGVRFIFKKTEGDVEAPEYIQFSDHKIAPAAADHYHLYWGDDRAALLEEVTNWPTYYPSALSAEQIVDEMMAH